MSDPVESDLTDKAENLMTGFSELRTEISKVIYGQERVIELMLAAILAGGHALLVGAPGLAKTRLVETISTGLGLNWGRIQFTPDLMPSDILGSEVLDISDDGKRSFRFIKGPIFTQGLMADEINRASPRTQSALLQAMQEGEVTIAGKTHRLPQPFHVLATQNPIEQEGTYPLPEAQLDRFLLQIDISYPDEATEREILIKTTAHETPMAKKILNSKYLSEAQDVVRRMPIGDDVLKAIVELSRQARPETSNHQAVIDNVEWGPSPRAGQALMLTSRARALLRGRFAPNIEDVEALAEAALKHRMGLRFNPGHDRESVSSLIHQLIQKL